MEQQENNPVILFDGVCNLCNASVQYVIKHDPQKIFRFASLQSAFGKKITAAYALPSSELNSFILLVNNKMYTRSTAALLVAKKLRGVVRFLYLFIIIPKFIRDAVYTLIAKNRYKWFGRKNECWLPTPELKNLFLDTTV